VVIAREAGHTRYPVCDETPDHVVGLIHVKDLIYGYLEPGKRIEDVLRSILFVPEGIPLDHLLHQFQRTRQHMAVVVDEYGGCAGVVTMENLLEELVGDIEDEFDLEDPGIVQDSEGIRVSGRLLLEEAKEQFRLPVDEDDEEYSTLGGYVFGRLGKPPQNGDVVTAGVYRFEVISVKGMRIDQIRVMTVEPGKGLE
jgi:CBS domain containing-hemolysin-like protein